MSTQFKLAIATDLPLKQFAKILVEYIGHDLRKEDDTYCFSNKYFSLFVEHSDECEKEIKQEVYGSSYDINLIFSLIFQNEPEASKAMMRLVDKLLIQSSGDVLLEFNGEFPVIIRTNGQVQVNHAFDDGTNFPFSELSMTTEIIHRDVE